MNQRWIMMLVLVALGGLAACQTPAPQTPAPQTTAPQSSSAPPSKKAANGKSATSPAKSKNHKAAAAPVPASPAAVVPVPVAPQAKSPSLEEVLDEMDRSAAGFRSAEADFVWEQYQKVVDEKVVRKGRVFFVRREKSTHMAANVLAPDKKDLIFTDGKIRFYQPRIDQVTEYDAGKNKAEVESFLVLGFGGRGHDLVKSFEVKLAGMETLDGVKVVRLELVPRSPKLRNMFERMTLWVDTARDISLKQQAFEPSGDFRTAVYTNIKLNEKVPDDVFKLKTTSRTKYVRPQ